MGKKARMRRYPQKFGRKFASHPYAKESIPTPDPAPAAPAVEPVVEVVVGPAVEPVVEVVVEPAVEPVVEVAPEAAVEAVAEPTPEATPVPPKPRRVRRKKAVAPKKAPSRRRARAKKTTEEA